jgi:hypothetical protein
MGGVFRRQRRQRSRFGQLRVQIHHRFRGLAAAAVHIFGRRLRLLRKPKRTDFLRAIRLSPPRQASVVVSNPSGDSVTAAIGGTLGRIAMLQVATIIGGMLARSNGTTAPVADPDRG